MTIDSSYFSDDGRFNDRFINAFHQNPVTSRLTINLHTVGLYLLQTGGCPWQHILTFSVYTNILIYWKDTYTHTHTHARTHARTHTHTHTHFKSYPTTVLSSSKCIARNQFSRGSRGRPREHQGLFSWGISMREVSFSLWKRRGIRGRTACPWRRRIFWDRWGRWRPSRSGTWSRVAAAAPSCSHCRPHTGPSARDTGTRTWCHSRPPESIRSAPSSWIRPRSRRRGRSTSLHVRNRIVTRWTQRDNVSPRGRRDDMPPRRWQFDPKIAADLRPSADAGPQSAHPWWPAVAKLQAASGL